VRTLLDPIDRSAEVLFGLIMVLAYTGTISVAEAGHAGVAEVLIGAIACNLAWAIVDAALYLMGLLAERTRGLSLLRAIRQARDPEVAHELIASGIPPGLAAVLRAPELEALRQRLSGVSEPPAALARDDFMAAAGVFLIVFLSTLPIVAPFLIMTRVTAALRVSQAIALVMLFSAGWSLGRHLGRSAWRTGLAMAGVGALLSAITFALGG
jgi:VIT1/CCC1 family predicted Fe2+/Mn2+ transporter